MLKDEQYLTRRDTKYRSNILDRIEEFELAYAWHRNPVKMFENRLLEIEIATSRYDNNTYRYECIKTIIETQKYLWKVIYSKNEYSSVDTLTNLERLENLLKSEAVQLYFQNSIKMLEEIVLLSHAVCCEVENFEHINILMWGKIKDMLIVLTKELAEFEKNLMCNDEKLENMAKELEEREKRMGVLNIDYCKTDQFSENFKIPYYYMEDEFVSDIIFAQNYFWTAIYERKYGVEMKYIYIGGSTYIQALFKFLVDACERIKSIFNKKFFEKSIEMIKKLNLLSRSMYRRDGAFSGINDLFWEKIQDMLIILTAELAKFEKATMSSNCDDKEFGKMVMQQKKHPCDYWKYWNRMNFTTDPDDESGEPMGYGGW